MPVRLSRGRLAGLGAIAGMLREPRMTNKPNLRWAELVLNDFAVMVYADNSGFCLRKNKANVRGLLTWSGGCIMQNKANQHFRVARGRFVAETMLLCPWCRQCLVG